MYRAVTSAAPAALSTPQQDIATSHLSDSLASSQVSAVNTAAVADVAPTVVPTTGRMTCDVDTTIDTSSVAEHAADVPDSRTKTPKEVNVQADTVQFGNWIFCAAFVTRIRRTIATRHIKIDPYKVGRKRKKNKAEQNPGSISR